MSQTVDRALSILPLLAEGPADLGQVADRLGVHKSTALRLLRTLHEHGLVYRQSDQRYRLGARLFALAQEAVENLDIREIAHPHLTALNEKCGHTVHLAVYEENEVLYIDKVESRYPVRMYSRIGKPVAITVAAVAKLLLADLCEAERRAIAEKLDYPTYTARSTPNSRRLPQGTRRRPRTGLGHRPRRPRGVHQLRRSAHPGCGRPRRRRHVGLRTERGRHGRGTPHPAPAGPPHGRRDQPGVLRSRTRLQRGHHQGRQQRSPHQGSHLTMTEKTALTPATHTTPPAKFSHGVKKGNILQVAGQVGFLPAVEGQAPTPAGPTLREQTLQTFANVKAILEEGGATWDDVMMMRVYLTDVDHFAEMNAIYNAYFEEQGLKAPASARTTVYVGLPKGLLIEIDALAVLS